MAQPRAKAVVGGMRIAARVIAGLLLAEAATASPAPELRIGRASEIDTQALRSAIERTRGHVGPSLAADAPVRLLALEEAIRLALEHNLRLQISALDRDIAEREVPARRAFFHPTPGLNLIATDVHTADPIEVGDDGSLVKQSGTSKTQGQIVGAFLRQELPTGAQLILGVDTSREAGDEFGGDDVIGSGAQIQLRQPLLRGGRSYVATAPIKDAEYSLAILESQLRAQILQVTAEAKQAYHNTILAERLIQVSEQAIERDRELIEASEALFRAGRASQRDLVSAQIQLSDDLSELASRRSELDLAELVLRDVLGLSIGEYLKPADDIIPFEPVRPRLGTWIEYALANRPEIQATLYRLQQSHLAVRVAGNAVLPRLDLVGLFRRNDNATSASRVYGFDSQLWIAGIEFEIPFGNVAARERLRAVALQHARIERELENQRRLIELEVRAEELSLRENLEVLAAQTDKVEQARYKLEIAQVRYQRGIADNFDVTDAQGDLVDAESDLLAAVVDYTNGLARLEASIAAPL
jgi:outer membrane protein TolC